MQKPRLRDFRLLGALLVCVVLTLPGLDIHRRVAVAGFVVRDEISLLADGDFEAGDAWSGFGEQVRQEAGEGRGASGAAVFRGDGDLVQTVVPPPAAAPAPYRLRGWSRAEDVDGAPGPDYSLYVDVEYADGTWRYGAFAPFAIGTHDWESVDLLVPVDRPVRALHVHCLFRGHRGRAWFDELRLAARSVPPGSLVFQGVPLRPASLKGRRPPDAERLETRDGLSYVPGGDRPASLQIDGRESGSAAAAGFLVRDVTADSELLRFRGGACPELGLALRSRIEAREDHLLVEGRVETLEPRDRALTLVFALPLDATGWTWGEDARRSVRAEAPREYGSWVRLEAGATGTLSRYPLAAVSSGPRGLAVAADPALPAQIRLSYHAGTRQLCAAMDVALLGGEPPLDGAAFRFKVYRFDGRWGFRAALEKLYRLFPASFEARVQEHGTWMPFQEIGKIRDWRDFGFKFHEGTPDVAFDDAHGILSFRYSEPLAAWMPMPPEEPRTAAAARSRLRDGGREELVEAAGMEGPDGSLRLLFRQAPWCDGAVWSLNPNPRIPGAAPPVPLPPGVDGEFLDSMEGYVTAELDLSRAHVRAASVPPTFDSGSHRPAVFKGQAMFEHARALRGTSLLFGNGAPDRFGFLCGVLDVLGREADWMPGGRWTPPSDAELLLWRSWAFQKPCLLLLNTDFDQVGPELMERYVQRCLAYGIWPGMFSRNASDDPYWGTPARYERDRPIFVKYIPLLKRLGIAGWQPVTRARSGAPDLWIERFGPDAQGTFYLTLVNATDAALSEAVLVEPELLEAPEADAARRPVARELISGRDVELVDGLFVASPAPGRTWMVEIRTRPR